MPLILAFVWEIGRAVARVAIRFLSGVVFFSALAALAWVIWVAVVVSSGGLT